MFINISCWCSIGDYIVLAIVPSREQAFNMSAQERFCNVSDSKRQMRSAAQQSKTNQLLAKQSETQHKNDTKDSKTIQTKEGLLIMLTKHR